jgi:Superinfection immunity protein
MMMMKFLAAVVGAWLLLVGLAALGSGGHPDVSGLVLILLGLLVYLIPTLVALALHRRNWVPVCIVNLFLGWTLIGWLAALVMAAWRERVT